MKKILQLIIALLFCAVCNAQIPLPFTYIPDSNFEQALIDLGLDDVLDHLILNEDVDTLTSLDISNKNIDDLTGIESFIALTSLNCSRNNLQNLDITANIALTSLNCFINQLDELDVSANVLLTNLQCYTNGLDNIDVSMLPDLVTFYPATNNLISIDVSANLLLRNFNTQNNPITSLNVNNNTALQYLRAHGLAITDLNLSNNPSLIGVYVNDNVNLTSLNLKSTGNTSITNFNALNNPNLTCIEVDDVTYSTTNWTNIDTQTSFSENCFSFLNTYIPNNNFEQALIDLGHDDVLDDYVLTSNINTLTTLNLFNKDIADATGIEDFIALTSLTFASNNNLTTINLSNLTLLENLNISRNNLATIDLSNLDFLENLNIGRNSLTAIDIGNLTVLEVLYVDYNDLTTLDTSSNLVLEELILTRNNNLEYVDVSTNLNLLGFSAKGANFTALDFSLNTSLDFLILDNNNLTSLNVKNGNNTNFFDFSTDNNPNLSCIEVDSATYSTNNWIVDTHTSFSEDCFSFLNTYIPDDNFEQALIDLNLDDVLDDYVLTSNINTLTTLTINDINITNTTGIEDFVALETLRFKRNGISSINVSSLIQLQILNLQENDLGNIDLSNNILLTNLVLVDNDLNNLDVFNNINLQSLYSGFNNLDSIDLSNNSQLKHFVSLNTHFTSLDLSNNLLLETLHIENNSITELNLSNHSFFKSIIIQNNDLTSLNIKNGNNTVFTEFNTIGNPNLTCIQVDDATYSTTNWTNIDVQTSFSEFCVELYTYVPDDNFEQVLIDLNLDDVLDDYALTSTIANTTALPLSNENISDLTGIEDFSALTFLDLDGNNLTTIDLSNQTLLYYLNLNDNNLATVDISNSTTLEYVEVKNNPNLTTIDVSNLTILPYLDLSNNNLTTIDTSTNLALIVLYLQNNTTLGNIDVSANINLQGLNAENTGLTSLNVQNGNNTNFQIFNALNNPNLTCIQVDDVTYSTSNWTDIDAGTSFSTNCPTVNVNDYELENITIYPNPTTTILNIEISQDLKQVTIYNVVGVKVLSENSKSIDISNLSNGIYLVKIESKDGKQSTKQFIKN